ncbi:14056_t:CDS:2, partial [Gigaspora rosea]
ASRPRSVIEVELVPHLSTTIAAEPLLEIPVNATAQRKIADGIERKETQDAYRKSKGSSI